MPRLTPPSKPPLPPYDIKADTWPREEQRGEDTLIEFAKPVTVSLLMKR